MNKPLRKAVLPVAGLGTRFLPATKSMPKEMLPVVDKPLIQYAVEEAQAAGITDFIFVTGRGKGALEDHFDRSLGLERLLKDAGKTEELAALKSAQLASGRVAYTRQQEPLGLGHAVWCARELVGDEPFAVLLPDDLVQGPSPCLKQMVDVYENTGGNVVGILDIPRDETGRYGILDVGDDDGRLVTIKGLVEKPKPEDAPSTLSIIGRYILMPEIFEHLGRGQKGAGGEIQLTDSMAKLIGHQPFHGLRFDGRRFDCGTKAGYLAANIAYALEREDLGPEIRSILKDLKL